MMLLLSRVGWPRRKPALEKNDLRVWNGGPAGDSSWRLALPHMPPFEDPALPHQFTYGIDPASLDVTVGCNCGAVIGEPRSCWAASEALAAWKDWHEQRGITL